MMPGQNDSYNGRRILAPLRVLWFFGWRWGFERNRFFGDESEPVVDGFNEILPGS